MDQPGVEVRPIKMMTGDSEFNEVFFTDARAPNDNVDRRGQRRLGGGDDTARPRAGRGRRGVPLMFKAESTGCSSCA